MSDLLPTSDNISSNPSPGRVQPSSRQQPFDLRQARPFIYKSVSEETRSAYARAIREFFQFVGEVSPAQIKPADVIAYRDDLRVKKRRKATTVNTKLAIIRSFFEYLKAGGVIHLNPAST